MFDTWIDIAHLYRRRWQKKIYNLTQEQWLLWFFGLLFFILLARLFTLQVVQGDYYRELLVNQHYTKSELKASRGNIFMTDKWGKNLQLTENVDYFNLFVDPKFVEDKERVIEVLTPIIYQHFCESYGIDVPNKQQCVENIEEFTSTKILPERTGVFVSSWNQQYYVNSDEYADQIAQIIEIFTAQQAKELIKSTLERVIHKGINEKNYIGFFDNPDLLEELASGRYPWAEVEQSYYLYIVPDRITNPGAVAKELQTLLQKYWYTYDVDSLKVLAVPQEIRYIKLVTNMNVKIAKMIQDAKAEFYSEKTNSIPLLHGVGLEPSQRRYYPYESFAAHILGYLDSKNKAYYGIEEFFNDQLEGKDGKIIWLSTPWIGSVGANRFEIAQPVNGMDIYLTIDPNIQKEVESIANYYQPTLKSDSIAITVMDPYTWKIKAMTNAPWYNPNRYEEEYELQPLTYDQSYIADNDTWVDIPLYIMSWKELRQATVDERTLPNTQKYVFRHLLGPQIFVDKNIAFPYEPGSVFKAITLGVWIDSDALSMYDFYNDPGIVQVWPYTISNVLHECMGDHTFLHAFAFSCNVWMVRIAQKVTKYIFYSYLKRLKFGEPTGIELAGEDWGSIPDFNTVSDAQFFNNNFWQGLLATPIQMSVAYSTLLNGGVYIKPTIVEAIYDPAQQEYIDLGERNKFRIFKPSTSKDTKTALLEVMEQGHLVRFKIPGFSLMGKTGTSQIAFKGQYRGTIWWTNGSFMGGITADDTKYVVAIQVRRPRLSPRWSDTAARIFGDIARFIVAYDKIEK